MSGPRYNVGARIDWIKEGQWAEYEPYMTFPDGTEQIGSIEGDGDVHHSSSAQVDPLLAR